MSYYTESLKTISEKITLVTLESVERVKLFTLNGTVYERTTNYFVVGVKDAGTVLTENTLPLSNNQWNFNPLTKKLTLKVTGDPKTHDISLTYRHFFSTAPVNLPYNLIAGEVVEWEPYLLSIGSVGQQLDEENTGIVLESQSSMDFINTDGYFDNKFDKLIWENQAVNFYSWIPSIPISEKIHLFEGVIETKSFTETKVSFKVKDFVYKLKNKVDLGIFSSLDGTLLPTLLGTPKRRIYGKADSVKAVSLDATLGGYALSGTISITSGSNSATGSGTYFLKEVSPGDEISVVISGETKKIAIESVQSNTALTIGKVLDYSISSLSCTNNPKVPYRYRNRTWNISGHKLRAPSTSITNVLSANVFSVTSPLDIFEGDRVLINNIPATVRRISTNNIVTESIVTPVPSVSDTISKSPISNVYFGSVKLEPIRDYTIVNTTKCDIILDPLAEFNIVEQRGLNTSLSFINGSRSISTSSALDLRTVLNSRDWIRSSEISEPDWYEILEVSEQSILLRTVFTGATASKSSYYKNVEYIKEESLLTADCMGMESSGAWIKTASDAVRNLVLNDAGFTSVNETSFTKANADCAYVLSIVLPESLGSELPVIRDVITNINNSVFGSLYGDSAQAISYSIFNSTKPESLTVIQDDDILSFSVSTNQKIANEVKINYRPYVDIYSGEDSFYTLSITSSFVNNTTGIKDTEERTCYLYNEKEATIYAQRLAFFKSLSSSVLTLKTKNSFFQNTVNDKIYLSLDRLFNRYAGGETKRIGVISGIKKDGLGCEITVSDLGNIYNRVMSIAPNTTLDYLNSSSDDIMRWGYIVDNDTETPDVTSETGLGSNLIG